MSFGVPNVISKDEIKKLESIENVNKVYLVMDYHTVLHNSDSLLSNLKKKYSEERLELSFSLNCCKIPEKLIENFSKNKKNMLIA